jgi:two-component system, LytTR family, response regulator
MISAVLIDDEQNNIESLQSLLAQFCPDVTVAGTAMNSKEGLACIKQHDPHLVFLDIEMPFGNAFDMLEKLMPVDFEVIFVTAFEQYAVKAIKYVALDYLLKPVSIEELKKAVNRARKRIEEKKLNTRIELLLSNMKNEANGPKRIGLPSTEGFSFEDIDNIVRLHADGNLTYVITIHKKIITSKSLKEFESLLPAATFCRIHHSHIINLNFVRKYIKGRGGYVELTDGTSLEVSSRKKEEFLEKFGIRDGGSRSGG